VDRHLEHAAMVFMLDDELGTHHGLSWADFVLLTVLDAAGGAAPATALARTLCTPASHLLLRLLPLEKTGLVERAAGCRGQAPRHAASARPAAPAHEARDTAATACAARVRDIASASTPGASRIRDRRDDHANDHPRDANFESTRAVRPNSRAAHRDGGRPCRGTPWLGGRHCRPWTPDARGRGQIMRSSTRMNVDYWASNS
jgi:hypothetical protein